MSVLAAKLLACHHWLVGKDNEYHWLPYLWASYLLFYFVPLAYQPWQGPVSLMLWLAGLLTLVLFFSLQRRIRLWPVLLMLLVGLVSTPWYAGGVILLSYAASCMGQLTPKRHALWLLVLYALLALIISLRLELPLVYLFLLWLALPMGLGNSIHRRNELTSKILRLSQQEAQAVARLQERERIRADLHDLLGQSLTTITLNMQLLRRAQLPPEQQQSLLADTEQLARQCLAQARETLHNNYQASLTEVLASCRIACLAKGVDLHFNQPPEALESALNHALAQAVRESVTNSLKHSEATEVRIEFQQRPLGVSIRDNGGGYPAHFGTGLLGVKSRIQSLGGTVSFLPGWQTLIRIP